eukprot:SAG22_NODE_550_length_9202_cov_30.666484_13_plen_92_part_01
MIRPGSRTNRPRPALNLATVARSGRPGGRLCALSMSLVGQAHAGWRWAPRLPPSAASQLDATADPAASFFSDYGWDPAAAAAAAAAASPGSP